MQCKSRKLKLLQNEAKCIVLKVKPRFFLVPGDTIGFLCKQKSWAILSLKNIPNRFLGQTFLWARAEVDKSAAWRNLEQNNFEMNLKKIKVWRKNHLWHQQPNLPPCVAHPAQHPPGGEIVNKSYKCSGNRVGKHTFFRGALAWTGRQWWWRRTSPCSWPRQQPGRSPGVFPAPYRSLAGRWGHKSWFQIPLFFHQLVDYNLAITCSIFTLSVNWGSVQLTGFAT